MQQREGFVGEHPLKRGGQGEYPLGVVGGVSP